MTAPLNLTPEQREARRARLKQAAAERRAKVQGVRRARVASGGVAIPRKNDLRSINGAWLQDQAARQWFKREGLGVTKRGTVDRRRTADGRYLPDKSDENNPSPPPSRHVTKMPVRKSRNQCDENRSDENRSDEIQSVPPRGPRWGGDAIAHGRQAARRAKPTKRPPAPAKEDYPAIDPLAGWRACLAAQQKRDGVPDGCAELHAKLFGFRHADRGSWPLPLVAYPPRSA